MGPEQLRQPENETKTLTSGQFTGEAELDETPAWEQVAIGRYMPRRIRGSFIGRALG
jgi:hypothetical protein